MPELAQWWPSWLDDALRVRLERAYDTGRGYHDLQHLTEVLEHVDELMAADDPARDDGAAGGVVPRRGLRRSR